MFNAIKKDLKQLHTDLQHFPASAIGEREQDILDINRDQLYEDGIDAYGNPIYPEYQEYTIDMKEARNRLAPPRWRQYTDEPLNHVALIQYGGFYRSFYFIHQQGLSRIWSSDPKTGDLVKQYGRNIFGIHYMEKLQEIIAPLIWRFVEQRLSNYK